ncbi:hypothetical protein [Sphingomonas jeddahensis]|uniref:Uncharacterized protein n=1 Tax=Sphingomonas jeddahensis TaxID=1915074 RepID=A0A1V2ETW5_9SPHN|nr:hypothetical protein [Sphingomonas jeddahensis]ONF95925.1 hypothetical protein SPHI_18520 [Sphingomonas jeddahensis]
MRKKTAMIAELEQRARTASTLAEGQRLQMEAEQLRQQQQAGGWNWLNLRFAAALPRN